MARLEDFINAGDVRMFQLGHPFETRSKLGVGRGRERLKSDHSAGSRVSGLVQRSGSVLPDLRQDLEMGDGLADHTIQVLRVMVIVSKKRAPRYEVNVLATQRP